MEKLQPGIAPHATKANLDLYLLDLYVQEEEPTQPPLRTPLRPARTLEEKGRGAGNGSQLSKGGKREERGEGSENETGAYTRSIHMRTPKKNNT